MSLLDLYRTQLRVLWHWKGGFWALGGRFLVTTLIAAAAFLITAWLLPGLTVTSVGAAIVAVILVAIFNAIIRTFVIAVIAPFSPILTGVAALLFQVITLLVVADFVPGVTVDGFLTALFGSFVYAIINTIFTSVLAVDQGGSYYGQLVRALLLKRSGPPRSEPGVVVIQIDGLAYPILAGRIRAGSVNTIASWVRNRTHRLSRWEALLPSMTSASQAGILHGNNDGIPAFLV